MLVAVAVAAVCLLALFGLQQQLVRGRVGLEAAMRRAEARRNILALVRDLNPAAVPEGSVALPAGQRLSWTTRPLGEPRRARDVAGAAAPFVVQLFEVRAQLTGADGRARDTLSVERMGWRRLATGSTTGAAGPAASVP